MTDNFEETSQKSEVVEELSPVEEIIQQEPEPTPAPVARSHYHPEVRPTAQRNQFPKRGQKSAKTVRP